jgi:hypothetical protein
MNKFLLVILLQVNCNKNSIEKTKKKNKGKKKPYKPINRLILLL